MPLHRWNGHDLIQTDLHSRNLNVDAYLCCPGPSLAGVDADLLRRPGVMTFGLNTSYPTIRPDVWIGGDQPECFDRDLWLQPLPKITKRSHFNTELTGIKLRDCPNVYFADLDNAPYHAIWGRMNYPDVIFAWNRSSLVFAIHVMLWMGAKRIHMLGCDMGGDADYCDDRELPARIQKAHEGMFKKLTGWLHHYHSRGKDDGVESISCTKVSPINEFMQYVPQEEAVHASEERAYDLAGDVPGTILNADHAWASNWKFSPKQLLHSEAVMVGVAPEQEDILPWWYKHYKDAGNDFKIIFADLGMSSNAYQWCKPKGDIIKIEAADVEGWFRKPFAMLHTTAQRTLWVDLDVEFRRDIRWIFDMAQGGRIAVGRDIPAEGHLYGGPCDERKIYNSGVLCFNHLDPKIKEWAVRTYEHQGQVHGDQDVFSIVARGYDSINEIGEESRLRLDHRQDGPIHLYHWTGPTGKAHIRKELHRLHDMYPLVSVMMPAYNTDKYISRAIKSVLNQSYSNIELIIVDNTSTDRTREIAYEWADRYPTIRVIDMQIQDIGAARNLCLQFASGQYLAWLDSDDEMEINRIEAQMQALTESGADVSTCMSRWISESGDSMQIVGRPMDPDSVMAGGFGPVYASILATREAFDRVGGFAEGWVAATDCDWGFRAILEEVTWTHVDEPLYLYRRHSSQTVQNTRAEAAELVKEMLAEYVPLYKAMKKERGKSRGTEYHPAEPASAR